MSEGTTTQCVSSPAPSEAATAPRPSIMHFLLWTGCSAGCLVLMRAVVRLQSDSWNPTSTTSELYGMLHGVLGGAELAGAMIVGRWYLRAGGWASRQPGHALLLVAALAWVLSLPLVALMPNDGGAGFERSWAQLYTWIFVSLALAYALWACAVSPLRWRINFGCLAALELLRCLYNADVELLNVLLIRFLWPLYIVVSVGGATAAGCCHVSGHTF